ncbi:YidC/Oxa1 family membrane protein insertase [Nocardiopsis potens]|uniref:YidC/Oxa1 family membrane protein insertase n=1 Tax=Nocardiopsis potens TaxID=1246458 RepID=UPI000347A02F|nr:membrane protein insertase YidC [Nocardiopsis potens]
MYSFGPIAAAIALASTVVTALTGALTPIFGGAAAAAAVVALTVLVRLALLPLSRAAVRGEKQRARLAPRIRELHAKHGKNPRRLAEEQQRLFQREGTSPLAGCLPMLAQTPVFIVLYGLFAGFGAGGAESGLLGHELGGAPLGSTLSDALSTGPVAVAVFAVLMLVAAGAAWATRRFLTLPAMRENAAAAEAAGGAAPALPGAGLIGYLPFMTVAAVAFVPLAAGLYLAVSGTWTVAERLVLRRVVEV